MDTLNYAVLIIGLLGIGIFWNVISIKERKKETLVVTISLFVLGIIFYIAQNVLFPL